MVLQLLPRASFPYSLSGREHGRRLGDLISAWRPAGSWSWLVVGSSGDVAAISIICRWSVTSERLCGGV